MGGQLSLHARSAIGPTGGAMDFANALDQGHVSAGSIRRCPMAPVVVTGAENLEHTAPDATLGVRGDVQASR